MRGASILRSSFLATVVFLCHSPIPTCGSKANFNELFCRHEFHSDVARSVHRWIGDNKFFLDVVLLPTHSASRIPGKGHWRNSIQSGYLGGSTRAQAAVITHSYALLVTVLLIWRHTVFANTLFVYPFSLPYVEAATLKIMRLSSLAPLTLHAPTKDVVFKGYNISKDTMVFGKFYAAHHSKSIWGDPEKFWFHKLGQTVSHQYATRWAETFPRWNQ